MKVLKFGGTSVGSAQRMKEVSRLITEDNETKIVVCRAAHGRQNYKHGLSRLRDQLGHDRS